MLKIIGIVALLTLTSCAPRKTFYVSTEYFEKKIESKSMVIVPFSNGLDISYLGDVEKEFGEGNTNELIADFIVGELPKFFEIHTDFESVHFDRFDSSYVFEDRDLKIDCCSDFYMKLPEDETIIRTKKYKGDYVLFLEDMLISSDVNIKGGIYPFPIFLGIDKGINFMTKYAIWDNKIGKLVSFGYTFSIVESDRPFILLEHWHEVTKKFVENIVKETPFEIVSTNQANFN